jgi:retron-type reverse transcriptase
MSTQAVSELRLRMIEDMKARQLNVSIDQDRLVDLIAEEISDGRILQMIRSFLEAGVITKEGWQPAKTGVPQGGVASPLWSNIFLTPFDHAMIEVGYRLTRWADDFVVVCRTRQEAEAALVMAEKFLRARSASACSPAGAPTSTRRPRAAASCSVFSRRWLNLSAS